MNKLVRHWAECAALTTEKRYFLSVQQLNQSAVELEAATKLHREGVIVLEHRKWRTFTYRLVTDAEKKTRGPANGINVICAECRNSPAMKRILTVYGRASA